VAAELERHASLAELGRRIEHRTRFRQGHVRTPTGEQPGGGNAASCRTHHDHTTSTHSEIRHAITAA